MRAILPAHLPSVAIPMYVDRPLAFVAVAGLPSRPGDDASHESISFTTGQCKQVKNICLTIGNCYRCDSSLLCAFQTCQPALALLLGRRRRRLELRRARPHLMVYQPQWHTSRYASTALDCLGVLALSLTDDEQSPSWWPLGSTARRMMRSIMLRIRASLTLFVPETVDRLCVCRMPA